MFRWFQKKRRRSLKCAMCEVELNVDVRKDSFHVPYEYDPGFELAVKLECAFCKTGLAVVRDEAGRYHVRDLKWDRETGRYKDSSSALAEQVDVLEEFMGQQGDTGDEKS